jgi:HAD superfamily hydrolase (TIGR01509 family)
MNDLTVIFDMDGVILDSERVYQDIERSMYDELGIAVSPEEHLGFMGTAERSMWTYMKEKYRLKPSVDDLVREERERFLADLEKAGTIPLMDGLLPLLNSLYREQVPCWIASSSSTEIISQVLRINDLEHYFRGYVSGDDVNRPKPDPEIFTRTASLAGNPASACIVIEDSQNGIRAARAAGMAVIALNNELLQKEDLALASLVIGRLSEIDAEDLRRILMGPGVQDAQAPA